MTPGEVLDHIDRQMGRTPRKLGLFRGHWRMSPPSWLREDSYTQEIFAVQERLLTRGRTAWGAVVQANMILFSNTGPNARLNSAADIIWSEDPACREDPEPLCDTAGQIFSFKKGGLDAETDRLGALLADEYLRKRRIPVPPSWAPAYPTVMSSIYVDRAHLPQRMLTGRLLPILVLPEATDGVMIVPGSLWPKGFQQG